MQLTLTQLESLLRTLEAGGASEFEYEDDKIRLKIAIPRGAPALAAVRGGAPVAAVETKAPVAEVSSDLVAVTSPFVGTFYRASSPESANFVEVGSIVKKGQTLCIVEAMKLMNEIECEHAGTVAEVLVENGKSVEYGQKLFMIRKA
ncbi:MAG TPA: acetyl-CoA carboxylase biotin carboxyl carrier protein [Polyangiaceae bacterium]|jgi:acetyl-CoA carboxylase biotin carboxyl carrier protein|nr:acetyl-CoA carboxylase biotin carboxyl carrier protein [Polyangiaceae bacterium]